MNYKYDSDPVGWCQPHKGDLVKAVDNAGNVTCFAYDSLHRVTGITYPSGPNSSSTPPKTFVYDTTSFSCPNGANVNGRMAEAYTGPGTAKTTDVAFCYSPRGEVTDYYQSTPNSGGYAHTTASYWENGDLKSIGGIPGMSTINYGMDSVGRVNNVSTTTGGQNPVEMRRCMS